MRLRLAFCTLVALAAATAALPSGAATILVEDFTGLDAGDSTKGPTQAYGSSLSFAGFTLTSQLNGVTGSQLAYAGDRVITAGLGVGNPGQTDNIGFTRSINNSATIAESIRLAVPALGYGGLSSITISNGFSGVPSVVSISGFASDPLATSAVAADALSYDAMTQTLSWTPAGNEVGNPLSAQASTIFLGNPAAVAPGSSIVLANGTTPSEGNEYGLRAFSFMIPEPTAGALALLVGLGFVLRRR
jgi:hypothetical protein